MHIRASICVLCAVRNSVPPALLHRLRDTWTIRRFQCTRLTWVLEPSQWHPRARRNGSNVCTLRAHKLAVLEARFTHDSQHVLAVSADERASLIDVEHGAVVRRLRGHRGIINACAAAADAASAAGGTVRGGSLRVARPPRPKIWDWGKGAGGASGSGATVPTAAGSAAPTAPANMPRVA